MTNKSGSKICICIVLEVVFSVLITHHDSIMHDDPMFHRVIGNFGLFATCIWFVFIDGREEIQKIKQEFAVDTKKLSVKTEKQNEITQ